MPETFSTCSSLIDLFLQLLGVADVGTDVLLILAHFEWKFDCFWPLVFFCGSCIWALHIYIRVAVDGYMPFVWRNGEGVDFGQVALQCGCCGVSQFYAAFGCLVVSEKVLRAFLAPADPLLAVGYYMALGECKCVVADSLFLLTYKEKDFYNSLPVPMKYVGIYMNLIAGGRWKIRPLTEHAHLEGEHDKAKLLIALVIFEELVENVGGLVMGVAAFFIQLEEDGVSILTIVSLATSFVSMCVETGKYLGDRAKIELQRSTDVEEGVEFP